MFNVDDVIRFADELKDLRRDQIKLACAERMIADLQKKRDYERMLDEILFPSVFPNEFQEMMGREHQLDRRVQLSPSQVQELESLRKIIDGPRPMGYTILLCAGYNSSGGDDLNYNLFLLVTDGRVLPVANLESYSSNVHRHTLRSLREMFVWRLPEIKPEEIAARAPCCLREAEMLSDMPLGYFASSKT